MKVLFILKYRENSYGCSTYSGNTGSGLSSGLFNSARFVNQMLNENGVQSVLVHAIDNNCIDRLVTEHKPTHVIIEAFWVVPEKFAILTKLHPKVKWIIRNHSELPFLSNEGIAIDWICSYVHYKNVYVSANAPRALHEMKTIVKHTLCHNYEDKVLYLPNYYELTYMKYKHKHASDIINVGCFGAIRPLKNHLLQAVASIKYAEKIGRKLHFHINATRIEGNAGAVLKNLQKLFKHVAPSGHKLIEHPWMQHDDFINLIKNHIDIGLCVSHSETFCIVAADFIECNVPIVTSKEVAWSSRLSKADPNSSKDIVRHMHIVTKYKRLTQILNEVGLMHYNRKSVLAWLGALNDLIS